MKRHLLKALAIHGAVFFMALAVHSVDTTITGGRMELVGKGEEVVFSGGVKLVRGADTVLSSEMQTNRSRDKVNAKGNVRITRIVSATETWKAFGDRGFYYTKDGTGYLVGTLKRAHVIRTEVVSSTETRVMDIYADRIDFAREGQRSFAQGNVYGKMIDSKTGDVMEFRAQEAEHLGNEGRVVLTGPTEKPVLTQNGVKGSKRITGKTIIYYIDARRLVSKDSAEAVMHQPHQEK